MFGFTPVELAELDDTHLWHPAAGVRQSPRVLVTAGEGCWLIDAAGNRYLDASSSGGATLHGHGHPRLDQAVAKQLARGAHASLRTASHPAAIRLAARLVDLAPWGLTRVHLTTNGLAARGVAVQLARRFHTAGGAPHRGLLAELSHTPAEPTRERIVLQAPRSAGATEERRCLAEALALLEDHADDLAALVFEPLVELRAGVRVHAPQFLRRLATRARKLGILLVADERHVAFGRTGTMLAMEQVGIAPDLLCLGAGLTGGYLALGATLATESVARTLPTDADLPGTDLVGSPLAAAVALASLDVFDEEDVLDRVRARGAQLALLLADLAEDPAVTDVRRCGLVVGIDVHTPGSPGPTASRVGDAARARGALIDVVGETLVVAPPLSISDSDLTALVRILRDAIRDATSSR